MASINTTKLFMGIIKEKTTEYNLKKYNLEKALSSPKNSVFYVTDELIQQFYKTLLYISNHQDVSIAVFDIDTMSSDIKRRENIIKNNGFELGFSDWEIDFKEPFILSEKDVFRGNKSLEIDMDLINKVSTNFVDVFQDLKVKPGKYYLFGGWIKTENFDGRMWIEVRDKRGFKYGNWAAFYIRPFQPKNDWVSIKQLFAPETENLTYVVLRALSPVKGKVYIDDLFLLPIQEDFLEY